MSTPRGRPGSDPTATSTTRNLPPTQDSASNHVWRLQDPPPPPFPPPYPSSTMPSLQPHPPLVPPARKRQYRFSVRADIDLLRLVLKFNPYAAPHGGRLHKWQSIADTLRASGIDIDFRRARDRTGLLLDKWRERDFTSLRPRNPGNHDDQAERERLLEGISQIESAAKPRDPVTDIRFRDNPSSARLRSQHLAPTAMQQQGNTQHVTAVADMASLASSRTAGGPPFFQPSSQGHLPPLLEKPAIEPLSGVESELRHATGLQFGAHHHAQQQHHPPILPGPPEKHFKNTLGLPVAMGSRYNQPLFGPGTSVGMGSASGAPLSPTPVLQRGGQSLHGERRGSPQPLLPPSSIGVHPPQRGELGSPYHPAEHPLPLLRQPGQPTTLRTSSALLGTASLDVTTAVQQTVSGSAHPGEGQNTQLEHLPEHLPPAAGVGGSVAAVLARIPLQEQRGDGDDVTSSEQLRSCMIRLEQRVDEAIRMTLKRLDYDDKRLQWDKEKESKRINLEQERITKEYEDRKAEREDRRKRAEMEKEERDRMLKIILRSHDQTLSEGDNNS